MNELTIDLFKKMMEIALTDIKSRENEFSQLDAVIGDGDHGQAIVTAMSSIVKTSENGKDFKTMLNDMGFNLMLEVSGSTSTLIGAFFLGMSDQFTNTQTTSLNANELKAMFVSGLANVKKQTKATVGDKTMMDTLIPAIEAMQNCSSDNIKTILEVTAEAAKKGAESTIEMKANFGRARNYGEKSIGFADSGATSWACMFNAFAQI